jgi:hypothetical protein
MKKSLFSLFIILNFISYGQTNVSGGIYQNTTWNLQGVRIWLQVQ